MVSEIELLVCDNCNTVMQADGWRGHTCMECGQKMVVAKFERQLTPHALDLCVACRENPPVPGRATCSKCVDWSRTSQ